MPVHIMRRSELLSFLRAHKLCVESSIAPDGGPQAAVVGYGVSDEFELVFDTLGTSRKMANLRRDPRIAVVVGWEDQTLQVEGLADEPGPDELPRLKAVYLAAFPDGVERERWPHITYVRVRPRWARYSDFRPGGQVVEFDQAALRGERD